jgi:CRISPR-associated protein Cas2
VFVVICYDIPNDKRRNRVSKLLEGFGTRVQKSVFECDIKPEHMRLLKARLDKMVREEDSIRYYYLCVQCLNKTEVVNGPPVTQMQLYFTI